jgi:predicted esterase
MSARIDRFASPHGNQPIIFRGMPLSEAPAAALMVHGRGASATDILSLSDQLDLPQFAYVAPQASDNTWYPRRFLEPLENNEPWLSSALDFLERTLQQILDAGIPAERVVLLGFSQGACLMLEFAARHARRYGALAGLSGALIGPDDVSRQYPGSLDGTPVFLGCSDADPHIPQERVLQTAEALQQLGGQVTARLYPAMAHTVNQEEIEFVRTLMRGLLAAA